MARTPWNSSSRKREIVDVRRRRPAHAHFDVTRVVQLVAQPGMRLEPLAVRQIDGVRGDVVDRRAAVGPGSAGGLLWASCSGATRFSAGGGGDRLFGGAPACHRDLRRRFGGRVGADGPAVAISRSPG